MVTRSKLKGSEGVVVVVQRDGQIVAAIETPIGLPPGSLIQSSDGTYHWMLGPGEYEVFGGRFQ